MKIRNIFDCSKVVLSWKVGEYWWKVMEASKSSKEVCKSRKVCSKGSKKVRKSSKEVCKVVQELVRSDKGWWILVKIVKVGKMLLVNVSSIRNGGYRDI